MICHLFLNNSTLPGNVYKKSENAGTELLRVPAKDLLLDLLRITQTPHDTGTGVMHSEILTLLTEAGGERGRL